MADLLACTTEPKERIDQHWHDKGKFAWILRKIRQIEPFEVRGRLNLFEVSFSWDEYPEQIREPIPMVMDALGLLDYTSVDIDIPAYTRREKS